MSSSPHGEPGRAVAAPRLVVEYDDLDDFLGDFAATLSRGRTVIESRRALDEGSAVQVVLSVPGLRAPVALHGTVCEVGELGAAGGGPIAIEFEPVDAERLAEIADRVIARDPSWVGEVTRVLIAEDNLSLSRLIQGGLEGSSRRSGGAAAELRFQFTICADGNRALDALRARTFDLAIVDIYLPVLDGAQFIAAARARLAPGLPIIAISAGGPEARAMALAAGADLFMDKPVRLRALLDAVIALLPRPRLGQGAA